MLSSELKNRFTTKSKWSTSFLSLAAFQVLVALGLLIPAFLHVRQIHDNDLSDPAFQEYIGKAFKVSGECFMFIVFEIWRLWLAIDGVIRMNSRTIYASASFTILSFLFSIMLVAESVNWIKMMNSMEDIYPVSPRDDNLRLINQYLQIALSVIIFLFIFPTFWVANRVTKDFGWDVYKKIGSSIKIQEMYIHLQWLSLMLKIDIFFEFTSYVLLLLYQTFNSTAETHINLDMTPDSGLIIFILVLLPSFLLCRFSISKESHVLMTLFIAIQIGFIANTVYIIVTTFSVATSWYAYMMYSVGVLIAAVATVSLAVKCQLNFGKGLKDFVQWHPWKKDKSKRRSAKYNSVHEADDCYGVYDRRRNSTPIDDDESTLQIDVPQQTRARP
ncbi:hypothetical protein FB192DRAFT_1392983 [Mucor lusitanicus]|uniref:Uncharacterized protein n=1 Tax=Mucor circinelloides f. lusitanicus TaxID=29924 RepID=A0A8H4BAN2_MUCCL|nr:hypothetical protein FB192DRAFT_1392983 [Mucor lusitanicus]